MIKNDVKSHIFQQSLSVSVGGRLWTVLTTEYSGEQKEAEQRKASEQIYWSEDMKTPYLQKSLLCWTRLKPNSFSNQFA